jgi:hypothetical protein
MFSGLQHRRALYPGRELVDIDIAIARGHGLLDVHLPVREVLRGEQAAVLPVGAHDLGGDIAAVEALVGGVDRLPPRPARGEGFSFGFHELVQRGEQLRLPEDLAAARRGALRRVVFIEVRKENARRVGPGGEHVAPPLHVVRLHRLDGIALGHLH